MLLDGLGRPRSLRELVGLQLLGGLRIGKRTVDRDGADFDLGPDEVTSAVAERVHVDGDGRVFAHVGYLPLLLCLEEARASTVCRAISWWPHRMHSPMSMARTPWRNCHRLEIRMTCRLPRQRR